MAVADNGGDSRNGGEFIGGALRIATCSDDACARVEAMGAANVGACFTVGFGGDTASVDDNYIGFCRPAFGRS